MNSIAHRVQTLQLPADQNLYLGTWDDEDMGRQQLYFLADSAEDARQKLVLLVPSNTLRVCGPMNAVRNGR